MRRWGRFWGEEDVGLTAKKKARVMPEKPEETKPEGICSISVEGFKSLYQRTDVEIRPLTLLAGANSSGKSSLLQPLLLLKQTLEAPYDPGALLLNGPHVRFSSFEQLLSRNEQGALTDRFSVAFALSKGRVAKMTFDRSAEGSPDVFETIYLNTQLHTEIALQRGMSPADLERAFSDTVTRALNAQYPDISTRNLRRVRCFLDVIFVQSKAADEEVFLRSLREGRATHLARILHVPALRRSPERAYAITAVPQTFPGPFDPYIASIIHHWQIKQDDRLEQLNTFLHTLGLTSRVQAQKLNDTQVELSVSRLKPGHAHASQDMVSIADVGFGVSQIMPLLVALLAAEPGQLVYIEQPEIHLHPNAQVALASVLVHASNRGVHVVAETHSALVLLGIQTLVAQQKLSPEDVVLHWFERAEDGMSRVVSAELDESGAFGDWPEDFDDVTLRAQAAYMDAAERRLTAGKP